MVANCSIIYNVNSGSTRSEVVSTAQSCSSLWNIYTISMLFIGKPYKLTKTRLLKFILVISSQRIFYLTTQATSRCVTSVFAS